MKKLLLTLMLFLTLSPVLAHAQYTDVLDDTGTIVYGGNDSDRADLVYIIGQLISILLSILGVILLVLVIYSGFLWMTAGGEADQVKKAKSFLINAIVGLIITLAAYGIANFVISALVNANIVG